MKRALLVGVVLLGSVALLAHGQPFEQENQVVLRRVEDIPASDDVQVLVCIRSEWWWHKKAVSDDFFGLNQPGGQTLQELIDERSFWVEGRFGRKQAISDPYRGLRNPNFNEKKWREREAEVASKCNEDSLSSLARAELERFRQHVRKENVRGYLGPETEPEWLAELGRGDKLNIRIFACRAATYEWDGVNWSPELEDTMRRSNLREDGGADPRDPLLSELYSDATHKCPSAYRSGVSRAALRARNFAHNQRNPRPKKDSPE